MRCHKIYHITLIVCALYFVNLNNNTFQLKRYYSLVHLRLQQKTTEKVISNCLFEVLGAEIWWRAVLSADAGLLV